MFVNGFRCFGTSFTLMNPFKDGSNTNDESNDSSSTWSNTNSAKSLPKASSADAKRRKSNETLNLAKPESDRRVSKRRRSCDAGGNQEKGEEKIDKQVEVKKPRKKQLSEDKPMEDRRTRRSTANQPKEPETNDVDLKPEHVADTAEIESKSSDDPKGANENMNENSTKKQAKKKGSKKKLNKAKNPTKSNDGHLNLELKKNEEVSIKKENTLTDADVPSQVATMEDKSDEESAKQEPTVLVNTRHTSQPVTA
jgi:hypothetical protein